MNEKENRCSTTGSVQTLTEAMYLLALLAPLLLALLQRG